MNKNKRNLLLLLLAGVCVVSVCYGIHSKAAAGTVTSYTKITWGISTGKYGVNGIPAFCAEYSKSWPKVGTTIDSIVESSNEVMRKALYYGYNGPANMLGGDARAHVLTAIAISDANFGEAATGASSKYDEFYWDIVNNPAKYPVPPTNFKAYLAITASDSIQNLAFYVVEKNGYTRASKASSDSSVTSGNSCYSLAGAQYGIYNNNSLSENSRVGTLTMDANGQSNTVELSAGTYYAREVTAPKGYAKSAAVTSFTVTPENTTTLNFIDEPQVNPIDILLQKVDAETGTNTPQGSASLKGAQFTVKYYAGLWGEGVNPETLGITPARTWVFATDEAGQVRFSESYKVSGDALYSALPLGTVTIRETKPSEGYRINDTIFVRRITPEGTERYVSTYSAPVITEEIITVEVTKYQTDTDIVIPDTEFEYTNPKGDTEILTTDENGKFVIKGLCYGIHTIREVSVVDGYILNDEVIEFVVDETTTENLNIIVYNDLAPYELVIFKTDAYGNMLENAEFAIYSDKECLEEVAKGTTDGEGILRFSNLVVGETYYLKEIKAPAGYQIVKENEEQHVYEICAVSVPVKDEFLVYIDGTEYDSDSTEMYTVTGTKENREVNMSIMNEVGFILPKTGSSVTLLMTLTGMTLCISSICFKKTNRKKKIEC